MRRTLRHKIADSIFNEYIGNLKVAAGKTLPPVRDLQKKYEVSSGTILSALAILETRGVVVSRHGTGCYVTDNPDGLSPSPERSANSVKSLGLICNSRIDKFNSKLQKGIDGVCRKYGYNIVVTMTDFNYEDEQIEVKRLIDVGCEGLVLYPAPRTKKQARSDYLNSQYRDFPIVVVDLALPGHKRPQVIFDNYRLGRDMTDYLIDKGHRRIAFMDYRTADDEIIHRSVMDRYNGYLEAMRSAGRPVDESDRWTLYEALNDDHTISLARLIYTWLDQDNRPTALIALDDDRAALTISVARELGIMVPEDLEVVGFDDLPAGQVVRPQFATSSPDFVRIGEVAADLLVQLINGEIGQSIVYTLSVPVRERETRPIIREALEYH